MHGISTCLCPYGAASAHPTSRREQRESSASPGNHKNQPCTGCYNSSTRLVAGASPPSCCAGAHVKTPALRSNRTCGSAPPVAGSHGGCTALDRSSRHTDRLTGDTFLQEEGSQWKFKREGFILSFAGPLTDSYDVEPRKLGQGTYGSVCRAVNKATKTVRAVKTISKSKVRNVKRFKQEISIMKSLDHPNIIKLFETFEDHKNVYLVMELCRGGELFDRIIEQGYFSEAHACYIMRCILAALFYLHKHGIVHRDLKPENFMFLDKGKDAPFKIIDFGLATRFSSNAFMSTRAGTPFYVAPQVLQGKYTYKCDMWSAGVIMYILLCGYPPFHGENDAEILSRVKVGRYSFNEQDWRGVSNEAKDLVRKLMAFDPQQRLSAEQALNHPWIKHFSAPANPASDAPFSHTMLERFRVSPRDHPISASYYLGSVQGFQALCKLKKAALTIIAQQMNESQIELLTQTFLAGLKKAGIKDIPSDLEQLMRHVDSDGSGFIDYTEFVAATLDKRQYIQARKSTLHFEDVCWAAFRVFDLDGNGRISAQDLAHVLLNTDVQTVFPSPASLSHGITQAIPAMDATQQSSSPYAVVDNMSPQQQQQQMWQVKTIIREVDKNGDGEVLKRRILPTLQIDFDEFMDMMRKSTICTGTRMSVS
ncbi:calcium-dependent protein kinase 2 [Cyclospora cayetanensis]|uniref:Calcium-dependent protein kinase 1 n=1 Tax=Cyclospora cayetanensis TaxID=88456 RepID=A0A6P6RQK3_9EIME|nr:calcium-dependent protein kinase 2 [Cyclospora cayetanensis]